jgi:hypothetical protein
VAARSVHIPGTNVSTIIKGFEIKQPFIILNFAEEMNDNYREYMQLTAETLGACQMVELQLKLYITRALEVARRKAAGVVPFGFSGDDYDEAPLGKLIDVFKKLTMNKALVSDLLKFKSDRNFIAHRAFVVIDHPDGEIDVEAMNDMRTKVINVRVEAQRLGQAVYDESMPFLGHYYFGDE